MKAARTRALNRKHAGTAKHSSTAKHTGTATRKAATAHKQVARRTAAAVKAAHLRAWSPDADVALCSARAVAESLRLELGERVSDSAVLELFWQAGGDADAGVSIEAALRAARRARYRELDLNDEYGPSRLLGLHLPCGAPHAVYVGPDGVWWSWGEPYDPADFLGAVVEEAWAVQWQ